MVSISNFNCCANTTNSNNPQNVSCLDGVFITMATVYRSIITCQVPNLSGSTISASSSQSRDTSPITRRIYSITAPRDGQKLQEKSLFHSASGLGPGMVPGGSSTGLASKSNSKAMSEGGSSNSRRLIRVNSDRDHVFYSCESDGFKSDDVTQNSTTNKAKDTFSKNIETKRWEQRTPADIEVFDHLKAISIQWFLDKRRKQGNSIPIPPSFPTECPEALIWQYTIAYENEKKSQRKEITTKGFLQGLNKRLELGTFNNSTQHSNTAMGQSQSGSGSKSRLLKCILSEKEASCTNYECRHFGFDEQYGYPILWHDLTLKSIKQNGFKVFDCFLRKEMIVVENMRLLSGSLLHRRHKSKFMWKSIVVMNMNGVEKDIMTSVTTSVGFFRQFIAEYQHFCPDVIYKLYLINCSFIFRTIWKAFLPVVPPNTRKKISVIGSDYEKTMKKEGIVTEFLDESTEYLTTDVSRVEIAIRESSSENSMRNSNNIMKESSSESSVIQTET